MNDWNFTLFVAGDSPVTVATVLGVLVSLLVLLTGARWLRLRLVPRLLAGTPLDGGTRLTIAALVHYLVVVIGVALVMQNAGLKLSAFSVLAGAVGVGLGFGLQNIVSNFISGLIVMFERPVRIGDRIQIGGIEGDVVAIKARSTVLRTAMGTVAIVPNQKFITEYVRNHAFDDGATLLQMNFKLARDQDAARFRQLLVDAAQAIDPTLVQHAKVYCTGLDAGGTGFELQLRVRRDAEQRAQLQSQLFVEIESRLRAADVRLA